MLFARQWVRAREDVEDVVQEALSRFWAQPRLAVVDLVAYLFTCVKHSAIDFLKARSRHDKLLERIQVSHAAEEQLFECPLEQEERRQALEMALQHLPLKQREVLVMRIWGGLTFAQIAQAMTTSPNTVASRYRYALTNLRAALAKEWVS
jgi:RNA polymerase sigma-70 factor (ECF subfamily)